MAFRAHDSQPDLLDSYLASPPKREVLRDLKGLIRWSRLRTLVKPAYKQGGPGQPGKDPVVLIKLLLLERLYALSDVQVVEEAADRLSFREFLGLRASDKVPDDSTLVRFRDRLRAHRLHDLIFEDIEAQLRERGIRVREGAIKIVDASLVEAAVRPPRKDRQTGERQEALDPDADFTVKKGKPLYGFKLHMAIDRETGLVTQHTVTPASVHDSQVFEELLDGTEGEVLADKAYDSEKHRRLLREHCTKNSIMRRAVRGKPLSPWHRGHNRNLGRVRGFIEGGFATLKRWRGCGRARYRGLEKFFEQMTWGILAHNLTRAVALSQG
jgi:transposase, IS5 family